jgi:kumamolisin
VDAFIQRFGSVLQFSYSCFDRIVINGYLPMFQNEANLVYFFRTIGGVEQIKEYCSGLSLKAVVMAATSSLTEDSLPLDFVHALDQIFQDAALRGVTVCFSSGDRGDDSDKDGKPRVHFPASSPHVISCGGTHWNVSSWRLNEVVWSETLPTCVAQSGGGVGRSRLGPLHRAGHSPR